MFIDFENIPSVYWTTLSPYSLELNQGVVGKYMGKNVEYIEYAKEKVETYISDVPHVFPRSSLDFQYSAIG